MQSISVMEKGPVTRNQQYTPSQSSAGNGDKVAKGYPAVTRFAQAPAPTVDGGNGLPHQLRQGVEVLSGMSMADTSVHYNSSAPARIGALAYAVGNQIHLGPGQEQHLPHEAWHVVQQMQGRVKPSLLAKGLAINNDHALETEADVMGQRAVQLKTTDSPSLTPLNNPPLSSTPEVVQRKIGFEFQAKNSIFLNGLKLDNPMKLGTHKSDPELMIEADVGVHKTFGELEIKTRAFEETEEAELITTINNIVLFVNAIADGQLLSSHPHLQLFESKKTKEVKKDGKEMKEGGNEVKEERGVTIVEEDGEGDAESGSDDDEEAVTEEKPLNIGELKFGIIGEKRFAPQVTVGVKFEKIAGLIAALTKTPFKRGSEVFTVKERKTTGSPTDTGTAPAPTALPEIKEASTAETKETQGLADTLGWNAIKTRRAFQETSARALRQAQALFPDRADASLIGLATILLGLAYHAELPASEQPKKDEHIKYWMPFLLRNGFLPYFNALKDKKKLFVTKLNTVSEAKTDIYTHVRRSSRRTGDSAGTGGSIEHIINLLNFEVDVMANPMTLGHGKIDEETFKDWGMKSVDDIGYSESERAPASGEEPQVKRRGAIIELRNLGDQIPVGKFEIFAKAVFDLIKAINKPEASSTGSGTPAPTSSLSSSSSSSPPETQTELSAV